LYLDYIVTSDSSLPISLYLKIEQGQFADLMVVSRASIELVGAINALAEFMDPTARIKVTIQSGTEGSLKLNSVVEWLTGREMNEEEEKRAKRRALILGFVVSGSWWLLDGIGSHYLSKSLDALDRRVIEWIQETDIEEDVEEIAQECRGFMIDVMRNKIGEDSRRRFYAELERDPVITGVGIAPKHDTVPKVIVPRDEFGELAREPEMARETEKRVRTERQEMLVVQPRLTSDNRAWRFAANAAEFAARITDRQFLSETLSGRNKLTLAEGLVMDADVEFEEEGTEGVWTIKSRTIVKVHDVKMSPHQPSFL
jgi:hypothetical protein